MPDRYPQYHADIVLPEGTKLSADKVLTLPSYTLPAAFLMISVAVTFTSVLVFSTFSALLGILLLAARRTGSAMHKPIPQNQKRFPLLFTFILLKNRSNLLYKLRKMLYFIYLSAEHC